LEGHGKRVAGDKGLEDGRNRAMGHSGIRKTPEWDVAGNRLPRVVSAFRRTMCR
jgi:hypothetical protein